MLVYCGQTVGWIKMPLGMELGLSPGHIVLHGDPSHPQKSGHPQFLAHVYCGQMVAHFGYCWVLVSYLLSTMYIIDMALCYFQFCVCVTVFQCIEKTCKSYMLAIDAGQSMQFGGVLGCESVTPLIASTAMAMTFVQSEPNCQVVGLASILELLDVKSTSSLPDICTAISRV